MIYEQRTFVRVDPEAQTRTTIFGRFPVDGVSSPEFGAPGSVIFGAPPNQVVRHFDFDVPGETIEEAFQNFDACFAQARAKCEADFEAECRARVAAANASRLVVPGQNGHMPQAPLRLTNRNGL